MPSRMHRNQNNKRINNIMKNNERIPFIDWMRVIACFLVMLVHASESFYAADSSGLAGNMSMLDNEQNRFFVSLYDGAFGRISVPLFMTISAVLWCQCGRESV